MPLARSVLNMKYASARNRIGAPRRPKRCGASPPNPVQSRVQVSASAGDSARMAATVSSLSVETPTQLPSGKDEAKGRLTGTKAQPWRVSSSPYALKNALPAKSDRFIAAQSWR
jgi:hypothetical protein